MEERWQRSRIRTYLRSATGGASDGLDGITTEQENTWIDDAYAEAWADCTWKTALQDVRIPVGAQQRAVNYPAGCAPGGVIEIYWWNNDARVYEPLRPAEITAGAHPDPIEDEGGDEWQDQCGIPRLWMQREQIHLWPATQEAGELKLRFRVLASFGDDDNAYTACDGLLVALKTVALFHAHMRERDLQETFERRYDKRVSRLRVAFSTGEPIPLAPGVAFGGQLVRLPRYYQGQSLRQVDDATGN